LLVVAFASPLPAQEATKDGPVIVRPRNLATMLGPSDIEVELAAEGVERVVILVDGGIVATLTAPPWRTTWDFGDGSTGHRVEAIAHFRDGRIAASTVRTSQLRVDQVESVDLVNHYAIDRNTSGGDVTDLTREDFRVLEDGVTQQIDRFTTEHKPLNVALVLDASLSMERGERLERAKEAALEFLEVLRPGDKGLVTVFNDSVRVAQEMTENKADLARAISGVTEKGGTALYDAVLRTSRLLRGYDGRRVLVLLSDGRDEAANGLEPGSLYTLDEALEQALRNEVMIFSIGLGQGMDRECVFELHPDLSGKKCEGMTVGDVLRKLADRTGGHALISSGPRELASAFRDVAEALGNQYTLAYKPVREERSGEWREIRVLTPGRDELEVVTRSGYYAVPREAADGCCSDDAVPSAGTAASIRSAGERRTTR
jgi:VWFA-related protein